MGSGWFQTQVTNSTTLCSSRFQAACGSHSVLCFSSSCCSGILDTLRLCQNLPRWARRARLLRCLGGCVKKCFTCKAVGRPRCWGYFSDSCFIFLSYIRAVKRKPFTCHGKLGQHNQVSSGESKTYKKVISPWERKPHLQKSKPEGSENILSLLPCLLVWSFFCSLLKISSSSMISTVSCSPLLSVALQCFLLFVAILFAFTMNHRL